jgi:hypothetical protein
MSRKSPTTLSLRELLITIGVILITAWLGIVIPFLVGDQDGRLESEDIPAVVLSED